MKKITIIVSLVFCILFVNAQYKKDGTPDMRYKANKQAYGNSSSNSGYGSTNPSTRYQSGYTKSEGSYVAPHQKTNSNQTNHDNFSTKDNYNYNNGTTGSRAKDYTPDAQNYGSGKTINQGPKGGQYYLNDKGNKVYVPKR